MILPLLGGLTLCLIVLLVVRAQSIQPGETERVGAAGWGDASSDSWERPAPVPAGERVGSDQNDARIVATPLSSAVRHVGPSISEIAIGVFVGLWMFALSAALIGLAVAAFVLGSFDGT